MKIKKIAALASVLALTMNFSAIPMSEAFAEDTEFFEDFEGYTLDANLSDTLNALMGDGWYMVDEKSMYTDTSAAPYKNLTSFAQVVNYGGRKCLMLVTPNGQASNSNYGLGRKFPGQGDAMRATGIWEIKFKFYPYATQTIPVQFLFCLNTLDGSAATTRIAQHSIVAAFSNKMYLGHRDFMTSYNNKNSILQHTLSGAGISLDWYDVKATVNLDDRYYSVEVSKGGKLLARRSPINFDSSETVGFLKFSALGITSPHRVYVDDVSIKPASRETLIYEEDFEELTKVELATSDMTLGDATESLTGDSYFEGFTPWRALSPGGRDYGVETDLDLLSQVVRLGDNPDTAGTVEKSSLVYMPIHDKLVDFKTQSSRGKVRLSFKIKPSAMGETGFQVKIVPEFNVDLCNAFELTDNGGKPAIVTDEGKTDLDASKWYDAEVVLDAVNKMATVSLKEHGSSEEVANFSKGFTALTSVAGMVFNAVDGASVYMDDIRIEYYEYDSSIDLDNMTDLMQIGSVKVGDTPVTSPSDISNNATVNVKVAYSNTLATPLDSLLFIAYYGDGMLLSTSSVKPVQIGAGEKGIKAFSFAVPSASVLDMSKVDKVSLCLWKGFKNSYPYCSETVFTASPANESEVNANNSSKPVITYSYNDSVLNISGTADKDSKYLTVQILKPGNTFEAGDGLANADSMVFYRAQVPIKKGKYSLDVRFDTKGNPAPTLVAADYPTAIYIDDVKQDTESVYLTSYSDFKDAYDDLNNAAAANDFAEFKNVLNNKRSVLNFDSNLLGSSVLGDELNNYYEYVKSSPLDTEKEGENSERFNSYLAAMYLNDSKTDNISEFIGETLVSDDLKTLCDEVLTTTEQGKYFTSLMVGKGITDPQQLEKNINEALILTAAKYGNGYGELKTVLEKCGSGIGITTPISATACRDLIGNTYSSIADFKTAYDNAVSQATQTDSGSGSSGGGGGGGGGGASFTKIAPIQVQPSDNDTTASEITPIRKSFNDIDNYEWAMTAILALADRGIISGVDESRFEPSRNITREEFAKILVATLGASEYGYDGNAFSDASDSDWFVKYINIAAKLGIVNGIGDGKFGTGNYITRQDMAVMIYNALQYRNVNVAADGFRFDDDGQIADYAKNSVAALHGMGAINGVTETTFEPLGLATRAQAAKIVYNVLKELQG